MDERSSMPASSTVSDDGIQDAIPAIVFLGEEWDRVGLDYYYEAARQRIAERRGRPPAAYPWRRRGEPIKLFYSQILSPWFAYRPALRQKIGSPRSEILSRRDQREIREVLTKHREEFGEIMAFCEALFELSETRRGFAGGRSADTIRGTIVSRVRRLRQAGSLEDYFGAPESELLRLLASFGLGRAAVSDAWLDTLMETQERELQAILDRSWTPWTGAGQLVEMFVHMDCNFDDGTADWSGTWNQMVDENAAGQGHLSHWIASRAGAVLTAEGGRSSLTQKTELRANDGDPVQDRVWRALLTPPLSESAEARLRHVFHARHRLHERLPDDGMFPKAVEGAVASSALWTGLSDPLSRLALAGALQLAPLLSPMLEQLNAQYRGVHRSTLPAEARRRYLADPESRTLFGIARNLDKSPIVQLAVRRQSIDRTGDNELNDERTDPARPVVAHDAGGVHGLRAGEMDPAARRRADILLGPLLAELGPAYVRRVWRRLHFYEFTGTPFDGEPNVGGHIFARVGLELGERLSADWHRVAALDDDELFAATEKSPGTEAAGGRTDGIRAAEAFIHELVFHEDFYARDYKAFFEFYRQYEEENRERDEIQCLWDIFLRECDSELGELASAFTLDDLIAVFDMNGRRE